MCVCCFVSERYVLRRGHSGPQVLCDHVLVSLECPDSDGVLGHREPWETGFMHDLFGPRTAFKLLPLASQPLCVGRQSRCMQRSQAETALVVASGHWIHCQSPRVLISWSRMAARLLFENLFAGMATTTAVARVSKCCRRSQCCFQTNLFQTICSSFEHRSTRLCDT